MTRQDITFHYTNEKMAQDLIDLLPLSHYTTALDAGSGRNKVWFRNLPCDEKYECEIEDGNDFFDWQKKVDWVIGNPPYHQSWLFTKKALDIATIGIAWLVNNQALNSHLTPKRIELMQENGFYLQKIQVVADKRWFGRYYFLIFAKQKTDFLNATRKTY